MNQNFVDFMRIYTHHKIAIAVSGGVDSICLLHWAAKLNMDIVALHVNHGLRTAAEQEAQYVKSVCDKLDIPCHIFNWTDTKPVTGIESAARNARYKFMTDFCHDNNIDTIMVAHQADDQIETFLMNLGRGSGLSGLAAMRRVTMRDGIEIVRPLLNVYRNELRKYCDDNNIKYFHDEMNDDIAYTRVRIRKNRHLLSEKLGISDDRILLAIKNLGMVRDTIDTNIDEMVKSVMHDGWALFSDFFLFDQPPANRLKFIGTLVQKIGGNAYQPRLKSLQTALCKLGCDNTTFTLGHCTLRRLGHRIMIVPEGTKTSFRKRNRDEERNKKHKQNKQ